MDRFQNVKVISSPPSHNSPYDPRNSTVITKTVIGGSRLFQQSAVKNSSIYNIGDSGLARSGFYSSSTLQDSMVRGIHRGLGSLPEDRLRKISIDFINLYGSKGEVTSNGLYRIQRQAYQKAIQKPELGQQTVKQLLKTMDQNYDGRITEDDVLSLCRRYLNCQKRPIAYSSKVQQKLAVARRLFKMFDKQQKGYLTEKQVPNLLAQTYQSIGKSFSPTEEDVKSWMKLTDDIGNGQVTLQQYERSIIRALKNQGIKIYDE